MPLREYLEKCKDSYLNLNWIPPVSRWDIQQYLHLWDEVGGGDGPKTIVSTIATFLQIWSGDYPGHT
jgi:hypothetical protein